MARITKKTTLKKSVKKAAIKKPPTKKTSSPSLKRATKESTNQALTHVQRPANPLRPVGLWLLITAFFVLCMGVIGAITRLTESGLSIVVWEPVTGAIPPLNEQQWLEAFDQYRTSPEYIYKNAGMSLDDFKFIFFWEWFHRLWGRLIGVVFFIPFVYFWAKGLLNPALKIKGIVLLILGGMQAVMGWYMVQSGLALEPAVSHYRLAAHLGLAFVIFIALIWIGLGCLSFHTTVKPKGLRTGLVLSVFVGLTIIWGAFVAGKDAGLIYNEFPLMGGLWIPSDLFYLSPAWLNFIETHTGLQFTHRYLALVTTVLVLAWSMTRWHESLLFRALGVMIVVQMSLGITTLVSGVNIVLATLHQAGAFCVVALLVAILHAIHSASNTPVKKAPNKKVPKKKVKARYV